MDSSLATYIERLEILAFFAGYPLIYLLVSYFTSLPSGENNKFLRSLQKKLPFAYALDGILYFGLMLRNLYPNYSFNNMTAQIQNPYLKFWAISTILFCLPLLRKKKYLSLLHSLVFFSLLLKDIILYFNSAGEKDILKNDMRVYTDSLLLNIGTLLTVSLIAFVYANSRKKITSTPRK